MNLICAVVIVLIAALVLPICFYIGVAIGDKISYWIERL